MWTRQRRRKTGFSLRLYLWLAGVAALLLIVQAAVTLVSQVSTSTILTIAGAAAAIVLAVVALTIWLRMRRRRQRLRKLQRLGDLLTLTPAQFELAVSDLLAVSGYKNLTHVGRAGDLTADIVCEDAKGKRVVVQCKRYAPGAKIGSPDIQTFVGMINVRHKADYGIFATTSDFSGPAEALAKSCGVHLINGDSLTRMMQAAQG